MIHVVFVVIVLIVWTYLATSENAHILIFPTSSTSWEMPTEPIYNINLSINDNEINKENDSSRRLAYYSKFLGEDYLLKINSFWMQFDPPERSTFLIFGGLYVFIFIVGVSGNLLVITMFLKNLLTPATGLVLNLAISDLIMVAKCPLAAYNNFMLGPALGDLGCRIYGFLGGLSGTASILTLSAIAIDRYQVVVYPLHQLNQRNIRRLVLKIVFIWLYSFIFALIPALDIGYSVYVPEGYLTTCSFDYLDDGLQPRIFMFTFFFCAYVIPLFIIFFCYFYILKVVICAPHIQVNEIRAQNENRLTIVIIIIILVWFVAWTPYSIVAMLGVFGHHDGLSPFGSMIPAIFCKLAACIDPYIYAVSRSKFLKEIRRLFNGNVRLRRLGIFRSSFRTNSTLAIPMQVIGNNAIDYVSRRPSRFDPNELVPVPEEPEDNECEVIDFTQKDDANTNGSGN